MRPGEQRRSHAPRREKSEYEQKVLDIRRTARVVAGGRRFSFRATVVLGDRNGRVSIGIGKGPDVSSAVEKAVFKGKKEMRRIPVTKGRTIPHQVEGRAGAAHVLLKPAKEGKGLVAGGPIRVIADLAGIRNLTGKILGRTPNKLNNARAVLDALAHLSTRPQPVPQQESTPIEASP